MKKLLKYFMFIFAAVAIAACGGDDNDEPEDPDNPSNPSETKTEIKFKKLSNCPISNANIGFEYNGQIYYSDGQQLLCYNPSTDKWSTLSKSLPETTEEIRQFFTYNGRLYASVPYYTEGYIRYFDFSNKEWAPKEQFPSGLGYGDIRSTFTYSNTIFVLKSNSQYTYLNIYNPESNEWTNLYNGLGVDSKIIPPKGGVVIANLLYYLAGYGIMEFDLDSYEYSSKLNISTSGQLFKKGTTELTRIFFEEDRYGQYLTIGTYSPDSNDYSENKYSYRYSDNEKMPICSNQIIQCDNRLFIGPVNASYYELIIQ